MARRPYHIARQEHLGDILDELEGLGRLEWRWDYNVPARRAIFNVRLPGRAWIALDTRRAEAIAQHECDVLGIPWRPVPHPGGESQRQPVVAWIEEERRRQRLSEGSNG